MRGPLLSYLCCVYAARQYACAVTVREPPLVLCTNTAQPFPLWRDATTKSSKKPSLPPLMSCSPALQVAVTLPLAPDAIDALVFDTSVMAPRSAARTCPSVIFCELTDDGANLSTVTPRSASFPVVIALSATFSVVTAPLTILPVTTEPSASLALMIDPSATFSVVTAPLTILPVTTEPSASLALMIDPSAILVVVTAPSLIFGPVTAFFFSCFEPTLFLPRWEAAKAVAPPSSRKTAMLDITFAYVIRLRICFTKFSFRSRAEGIGMHFGRVPYPNFGSDTTLSGRGGRLSSKAGRGSAAAVLGLVRGLGEALDHAGEGLDSLVNLAVLAGGVAGVDALEDDRQLPVAEGDESPYSRISGSIRKTRYS